MERLELVLIALGAVMIGVRGSMEIYKARRRRQILEELEAMKRDLEKR